LKPSPKSNTTWDECENKAGAAPKGACITLGKHLVAKTSAPKSRALMDITRQSLRSSNNSRDWSILLKVKGSSGLESK
jgi:hypothetical protein